VRGRGIDDAGMTAEPEVVVGAEVEHGFDGRAGHGQTASQAEPVLALEFPASTLARIGFHHPASNRLGHAGEGRRPGSCLPHCEVVGILNGTDPMGTARIVGLGHATPRRIVSSAEIERELGLESGWIERRTGVRTRRVCAPEESCSTLAVDAARRALDHCRIAPADIGLVLLATSTPDYLLPPTAPAVAERLGCRRAGAVDLAGACAGFLYALILAAAQVEVSGRAALVIAANVLSRRLDPIDPSSRALFADGAGAVVVSNESTLIDLSLGWRPAFGDRMVRRPMRFASKREAARDRSISMPSKRGCTTSASRTDPGSSSPPWRGWPVSGPRLSTTWVSHRAMSICGFLTRPMPASSSARGAGSGSTAPAASAFWRSGATAPRRACPPRSPLPPKVASSPRERTFS
jgi:hypothetical protein